MRLSIASPQIGLMADPAPIHAAARAADQVGYSGLWVLDRLPAPLEPCSGYGGFPGVPLPAGQERALDPFVVLATIAALTERVRIGTSVLVAPWYPPVVLARLLTSLDVMSGGRLAVGLGLGWSLDEYAAAGADFTRRGRHLEEVLDVLDVHWGDGDLAHDGERCRLAPSHRTLAPVQEPRPPVYLAAYTPAALDRVARRADGWMPAGVPLEALAPMWDGVRATAGALGRDVERMDLVVRANVHLTERPVEGERAVYEGDLEQVLTDLEVTRRAGADELIVDLGGQVALDEALDGYARIADGVGLTPAGRP